MTNEEATGMHGKTVLVTGATSGIGYHTARGLAALGAKVLLHGRSPKDGAIAVETIKRELNGADITFVGADLSSLAEIRRLAEEVLALAPRLDVLVNNAGLVRDRRSTTVDGFETTFAVNHLAPFYLTHLLIDRIKASAPARIVTVASSAHATVKLNFDDLSAERSYSGGNAYSRSKLANILFTYELARRLEGTGVTANCVHPGTVRSGFARDENGMVGIVYKLFGRFFLTPEEGAKTSIHVASAPDLHSVSGQYFAKCKPATPSRTARNPEVSRRLWKASEAMLGITF
jgi:NAD(P)-dependent dehydrogenase (short-subunit alcohol dehydrogenase family)